jgi:hypothetical protein
MWRLRRLVQWCLGIQALTMLGASALILFTLFSLRSRPAGDELPPSAYPLMIATALILPLLGAIPSIAWWTLRKSNPSARRWTIAASILNILMLLPLMERLRPLGRLWPFYAMCGATGILGLIAFWRNTADGDAPKVIRLSGDGTSKAKDYTSQIVSVAILWLSIDYWHQWGVSHHLTEPGLMVDVLLFQLAILLNTFGHEMGHFVAGWASGMILRRFQVGPFVWAVRNGCWNFHFERSGYYGGAVGMVSPTLDNIRGRQAFLMMGGPVASLVIGAVATTAGLSANGHAWEPYWAFLSMIAALGLTSFVINLIPLKSAANYSDGAQLLQIVTNGEWAHFHIAFAMVASSLVTSIRPRDFDVAILNRSANFIRQGEQGLLLRLFACKHYLDLDRIPEALVRMQEAEALFEQSTFQKPQDICCEFLFVNAFYKRDLAAADLWWQQIEALSKIEKDADYWLARSAHSWLKGEREDAREAWEQGNLLALRLPSVGAYDSTRRCMAQLKEALDEPMPTVPPSLHALNEALTAFSFSEPAVEAQ